MTAIRVIDKHSELTELDYASAGHTGFASTDDLTTTSGVLQTDIDTKLENVVEDITPQLGGDLGCGGYNLDNVGKFCSLSFATVVYNDTGATLVRGTAVTICGLNGEVCTVCKTDNREVTKMPCCGIIYADITNGNEGCGIRLGRINMNTSGMAGNEGDRLYVQPDGTIDTTIPTSGMVQRVGFLVVKASGSAGRICVCIRGPRSMYSAKDQHPIVRMGDDAGHQKIVFNDYTNNEVAAFDDSGNLTLSGTVDGVDVATLKSDYDSHEHDDRYYTESEVDTISGSLNTKIDGKDNYQNWKFAVDGVTKDDITSEDVLNFVGGDNITITRSADDEITISGSAGGDGGDVTAAANITDNRIVRGDGGAKGIQESTALISNAGEMTNSSQPAFLVNATAIQENIATSSDVTVIFGIEIFDQGNDFASNTFTAPITGRYQFNLLLRIENWDKDSTYYQIKIVTSNRTYTSTYDPDPLFSADPPYFPVTLSTLADMDINDTAYAAIRQASGTQQTDLQYENIFSGYLAC